MIEKSGTKAKRLESPTRTVKIMQTRVVNTVVSVMLAWGVAAQPVEAASEKLKVYILAGQSNMEGHAEVCTFDYIGKDPLTAPMLKEMRNPDGTPRVCDKVWMSYLTGPFDGSANGEGVGKLTAGFGARGDNPAKDGGKIGPEFTFGIYMQKELKQPILLIKTAWGGRSLNTEFRPPSAGQYKLPKEIQEQWDKHPQGGHGIPKLEERKKWQDDKDAASGVFYRMMIEHVKKVLADPKRVCPEYDVKAGYELAGFVWLQGFNDLVDGTTYPNADKPGGYDLYSDLLAKFIRDVRKDLSAPKMPFVIGVLGVDGDKNMNFRKAMAAPADMPEFKGNVVAVETAPFWDYDIAAAQPKQEEYDNIINTAHALKKDGSFDKDRKWENYWKPLGKPLPEERILRFVTIDPAEKKDKLEQYDDRRFRDITLPAGMENWYMPDFDDRKWTSGKAPVGKGVWDDSGIKLDKFPSKWGAGEFILMRTSFEVDDLTCESYRIAILARQGFKVYLNGNEIHTYIWWMDNPYYRTIVLEKEQIKYLKKGKNVLAAYANDQYGPDAPEHYAALDLWIEGITRADREKLDVELEKVFSSKDKECLKGASNGGYHYFGSAKIFAQMGKAFAEAMLTMQGDLEGAGTFKEPVIKDYGLKNYLHLSKDLPHSETNAWKLVCTMPYNCHFQPWVELESPKGKVIQFNSSNPLVGFLTQTETYTTGEGEQTAEARNWISGEGAIYTIPAGVTVSAVQYRETGFNTTFAGSFECNDNDYNILWKKAARTAYVCMREWFFDCPDRERLGFWGDGTPELNQCFYVFDTKAHQLAKNLVLRKLEPGFFPGQHLEFLGEYGLWYYYLQTGDLESIRKVYEPTKTFLFETYKFGDPEEWFDWGKGVDTAVIETSFHYVDLKALRKMAVATGHEEDLPAIDAKLDGIKKDFDSRFWKGKYYMSSQVTEPDDRANAMAVNAGLADLSKWDAICDNVLARKTYSSSFFDRWVFEALCKMGKEEAALLRMHTRFKTMIPCRFTTLWEHYDRWWASRDAFDDASSLNHGWNPPAIILSQIIAGVSPVTPGWSTYQVLPKEAFLNSIKVVVPSVKGEITAEIKKTTTDYSLTVVSPPNTTAIIGVPRKSFTKLDSITVNKSLLWKGSCVGTVKGVTFLGEDAGYIKFQVEPGTWTFVGNGELSLASPKPLPPPPSTDIPLEKKTWTATASVPDGAFLFSGKKLLVDAGVANALDGDAWTGWRDLSATNQYSGQWFQVDMKQPQTFNKIVLDNTWALWDSPSQYSVTVSNDGTTWGAPIAAGAGELGITTITFPAQTARHIRITQTGTNTRYRWSIYEIDVYKPGR